MTKTFPEITSFQGNPERRDGRKWVKRKEAEEKERGKEGKTNETWVT